MYTAVAGTWKTIPQKNADYGGFFIFCEVLKASVRGLP